MTFHWKVIFVICLFFSAKPLRYSRSICPVFVGATLRGRPSMGKISFQCRPCWHATNFVHFAALLLMTGFSYIPQNRANAPCVDDAALGKMFFLLCHPRTGSSVTFPGDHAGSPLRRTHGSSTNYKYMSSVTDIVGQGSHSVRTRLI